MERNFNRQNSNASSRCGLPTSSKTHKPYTTFNSNSSSAMLDVSSEDFSDSEAGEKNSDQSGQRIIDGRSCGNVASMVKNLNQELKNEIPRDGYLTGSTKKSNYHNNVKSVDTPENVFKQLNDDECQSAQVVEHNKPFRLQKKPYGVLNTKHLFSNEKITLDNPAILDQQLEALEYHKRQMERKGLLTQQHIQPIQLSSHPANIPKLSTSSLISRKPLYSDTCEKSESNIKNLYSNILPLTLSTRTPPIKTDNYYNVDYRGTSAKNKETDLLAVNEEVDDLQSPPSPVSSSYSELLRASCFTRKNESKEKTQRNDNYDPCLQKTIEVGRILPNKFDFSNSQGSYVNMNEYNPNYSMATKQSSSYESIYEPINPRSPSNQLVSRSSNMYAPSYSNLVMRSSELESSSATLNNSFTFGDSSTSLYGGIMEDDYNIHEDSSLSAEKLNTYNEKEAEVEALTDLLVNSLDVSDGETYGICFKCKGRVVGENSGCTAMDKIYHISCFTCTQCQINLQGKAFYALEGNKPYCEYDYLQTLEKCCVCMKPILERILRATGKPYHPQCFTCVICGIQLDGIPFTVDSTNHNYCIEDFHRKFAPRCCVCKEPIMPEIGEEETIRVVALDRSFHFKCYKCEDCGLLLSSESEGRGCYPLDDHVLCKNCNAKRVQALTNHMTTEL